MEPTSNAVVQRAYDRVARVYDFFFGAMLQPGRRRAIGAIASRPGLRVLELGIGTGLTAEMYHREWNVVGVDLSKSMLAQAEQRIAKLDLGSTVRLLQTDGARLPFADNTFDVVLAPYVMSVVPDPIAVGRELSRVCRPEGQILLLNHFLSHNRIWARLERWVSPLTSQAGGFHTDLSLPWLLSMTGLHAVNVTSVNMPGMWKLVTCVKQGVFALQPDSPPSLTYSQTHTSPAS
ncbi:MAG: methyltransferase domain-containing protein [Cyanobacteria bacterium]|nr:methyltransferase domain-containing protein [Cyanobacteriota bacterium]